MAAWLGAGFACALFDAAADPPAAAARELLVAVATFDALKADGLICEAEREAFRADIGNLGSWIGVFEFFVGPIEVEVDDSQVEFATVDRQGPWVVVRAQGELRAAVGTAVDSETIHEQWFMK